MDAECPGCSLCCPGCAAEKYGREPEPHVCGEQEKFEAKHERFVTWPNLYNEHGGEA